MFKLTDDPPPVAQPRIPRTLQAILALVALIAAVAALRWFVDLFGNGGSQ